MIGTVPAIKPAAAVCDSVAIWATAATTASDYQANLVKEFANGSSVVGWRATGSPTRSTSGTSRPRGLPSPRPPPAPRTTSPVSCWAARTTRSSPTRSRRTCRTGWRCSTAPRPWRPRPCAGSTPSGGTPPPGHRGGPTQWDSRRAADQCRELRRRDAPARGAVALTVRRGSSASSPGAPCPRPRPARRVEFLTVLPGDVVEIAQPVVAGRGEHRGHPRIRARPQSSRPDRTAALASRIRTVASCRYDRKRRR